MKKTDEKRQAITEKVADHLLAHGLKRASLRQLAETAGLSDRMLLHYFTTKEELLTAALNRVTERLVSTLESVRSKPLSLHLLLSRLTAMLKNPLLRPYLRLWLELTAQAAGGDDYYGPIAREICAHFYDWIASALKVERERDRQPLAALAFALLEGLVILDVLGFDSHARAALKGLELYPPSRAGQKPV
jgi:AcrR family transcriptional regulator